MELPKPKKVQVFINHSHLDGLKILHLSDLHINKKMKESTLLELINICTDLDYDFAVITGDIIDCKTKNIIKKLQVLNKLASIKPVYFISGNHDIIYGLEDLKDELSSFVFMDNKSNSIDFNGNKICIVGLADRFSKFFGIRRDEKRVRNFLESNEATIFISHQPKDYKFATKANTPLFLCGHTHGGQIFPFHFLVKLVQPFLSGLFYRDETAIYVNKGLGTWGINYRYKASNEIAILNLIDKSVKINFKNEE